MRHVLVSAMLCISSFYLFSTESPTTSSHLRTKTQSSLFFIKATTSPLTPAILCAYTTYAAYAWLKEYINSPQKILSDQSPSIEYDPFPHYRPPFAQEVNIQQHPDQCIVQERLTDQHKKLEDRYKEYISLNDIECSNSTLAHQKQRIQSLESFLHNPHASQFYTHTYHLTAPARILLKNTGHQENILDLTTCFGNAIQHTVHSECIDVINELASIKSTDQLTDLDTLTLNLSILGCQAAKAGHVTQAYTLADFCWAALDCTKAVGLGVIDGVCATANTVIHPLQTVGNVANTVCIAAYYLGKVVYEVGDLSYTYYTDPHAAQDKWNRRCNQIKALGKALKKRMKEITIQDAIHFTVACTTETILTGKCLGALQQFYKVSKIKGLQFVEKARAGHMVAMTSDGIPVKVASKASQLFSLMENVGEKVKNGIPKGIRSLKNSKILREPFNFTAKAAQRMQDPNRSIPINILKEIIKSPIKILKDPKRLTNANMYYSRMWKNGKLYNVEVLYDKSKNQILHFLYRSESLGPLSKI